MREVGPDLELAEEGVQAKQKELDDLRARFDQLQDKALEFERQVGPRVAIPG